jgi:TOTE conflict system primase-like protein/DnaB helicase-like protein
VINKLAEIMANLFQGREGSCAIKIMQQGRKSFITYRDKAGNDIPLTPELCEKHLKGEISLGSYPLDQEDKVKWAALDFDGKKGNALQDAVDIKTKLESAGLICWLERSQSGNGIHLWLFFDKKISAKYVRAALAPHVPEFFIPIEKRQTSFDRLFPNQNESMGGYGNLCALPLNGELVKEGKTAFIDNQGKAFEDQKNALIKISDSLNKSEVLEEQGKKVSVLIPPKKYLPTTQAVPGGTKLLAPQGCAWLRSALKRADTLSEPEWYAALCQFAKVENGEVLAHRFSQPYPGYSYEETQKKFEQAKDANLPMSCENIWEKFGDCGKRCAHLGVKQPWQIAQTPLYKLDEGNKGKIHDSKDLSEAGRKIIQAIASGKRQGFAWGYDLLDDYTELRPRNLIIVAARQGMGKTAVMIDASVRGAERGIPQYMFSIEMGYEELSLRYIARLSGVDQTVLVTGKIGKDDRPLIDAATRRLEELPIYVDDSTRELDRMLDNAGELTYKNGTGVIWVDYLQLVRKKGNETKKDAVDRFVDGYKQMSKIIDSPVVALAQLNRGEEFAEGDDDLDSWLKDSGDIEQTADVIHYIRGSRGPGVIERRWRLHKERHRSSGYNFKFLLNQGIFRYEPVGFWNKRAVVDEMFDQTTDDSFMGSIT